MASEARLAQLVIGANDLAQSRRFYQEVMGLQHLYDGPQVSAFAIGGVRLLLTTRPGFRAPEQQGVKRSPAACSASLRTKSRCSGVPSSTFSRQPPQMPCSQDSATGSPAAISAAAAEPPAATGTHWPVGAQISS